MPARKPIRRSQLISPFGVGSMVDFPRDESLMPAGIDAWDFSKQECPPQAGWVIREERLEARLQVTHFRMPPEHRDRDVGVQFPDVNIPFVRFPRWHYCHHCGGMEMLSPFTAERERCRGRMYEHQSCAAKPERKRPFLIPVRFVVACDRGHIQDFPFMQWLHRDVPIKTDCKLRMRAGRSSAGLSGITISCSCGQSKNLGDVFRFDETKGGVLASIGSNCTGLRPWLGDLDTGEEGCGKFLRVLQRGASNVYFPYVVSSIYLPFWAEHANSDVIAALNQPYIWDPISRSTVNGKVDPARCRAVAEILGVDVVQFEKTAQRKLDGSTASNNGSGSEEDFRLTEYRAICESKVGPNTELYVESANLAAYEADIAKFFSRIRLVHKLRETRALVGFTRILPPDGSLESNRLQSIKYDSRVDWLPAIKVYGEGIFLELNQSLLEQWSRQVLERRSAEIKLLVDTYNSARTSRQQPYRSITPKFLLLHTLAHVLINQLSFDCGYGSASLRERIYCNLDGSPTSMQGILIYTASGDSEGTMGGLVRQGKSGRFESTFRRAIKRAGWCSLDPVCIESTGQGSDNANLAACHGCCLLPETCCEEGNRLLDRAMLVGIPTASEIGFFNTIL
ncbi:MAG: DUF1998 domain-containing protein [Candidatus Omnitrophota bacterium]